MAKKLLLPKCNHFSEPIFLPSYCTPHFEIKRHKKEDIKNLELIRWQLWIHFEAMRKISKKFNVICERYLAAPQDELFRNDLVTTRKAMRDMASAVKHSHFQIKHRVSGRVRSKYT